MAEDMFEGRSRERLEEWKLNLNYYNNYINHN